MKLYFYRYDSTSNIVEITVDDYEEVCDKKGRYYVKKQDDFIVAVLDSDLNNIAIDYQRKQKYLACHGFESFTATCYSLELDANKFIEDLRDCYLFLIKDMIDTAMCLTNDSVDVEENL